MRWATLESNARCRGTTHVTRCSNFMSLSFIYSPKSGGITCIVMKKYARFSPFKLYDQMSRKFWAAVVHHISFSWSSLTQVTHHPFIYHVWAINGWLLCIVIIRHFTEHVLCNNSSKASLCVGSFAGSVFKWPAGLSKCRMNDPLKHKKRIVEDNVYVQAFILTMCMWKVLICFLLEQDRSTTGPKRSI